MLGIRHVLNCFSTPRSGHERALRPQWTQASAGLNRYRARLLGRSIVSEGYEGFIFPQGCWQVELKRAFSVSESLKRHGSKRVVGKSTTNDQKKVRDSDQVGLPTGRSKEGVSKGSEKKRPHTIGTRAKKKGLKRFEKQQRENPVVSRQKKRIISEVMMRHGREPEGCMPEESAFWPGGEVDTDKVFPNVQTGSKFQKKREKRPRSPEPSTQLARGDAHVRQDESRDGTVEQDVGATALEEKVLRFNRGLDWVALSDIELSELIDKSSALSEKKEKLSLLPDKCQENSKPTFESLGIAAGMRDALADLWKIEVPTEIQTLAIPRFLLGENLLIADQTGTGKTLAYALPLIECLYKKETSQPHYKRRGQRCRALVVLPNRELIVQTLKVFESLILKNQHLNHWVLYAMAGGMSRIKSEWTQINNGVDILFTTPERLMFHLDYKHLYLEDLSHIVFDEADALMSSAKSNLTTANFIKQMKKVISQHQITIKQVQFVFVSATVSPYLMEFLKSEFARSVTSVSGSSLHKSAATLKQDFLFDAGGDFKKRLLLYTLKKRSGLRTMIFCNTQSNAKGVASILKKAGYSANAMTSDLPPKIRQKHYEEFITGQSQILASTDLTSRGLDIACPVEHVILYDFPTNAIDYLHRVGRTARAGGKGLVTAFLTKKDHALATAVRHAVASSKSVAQIKPTLLHRKKGKKAKRAVKQLRIQPQQPTDHASKVAREERA